MPSDQLFPLDSLVNKRQWAHPSRSSSCHRTTELHPYYSVVSVLHVLVALSDNADGNGNGDTRVRVHARACVVSLCGHLGLHCLLVCLCARVPVRDVCDAHVCFFLTQGALTLARALPAVSARGLFVPRRTIPRARRARSLSLSQDNGHGWLV